MYNNTFFILLNVGYFNDLKCYIIVIRYVLSLNKLVLSFNRLSNLLNVKRFFFFQFGRKRTDFIYVKGWQKLKWTTINWVKNIIICELSTIVASLKCNNCQVLPMSSIVLFNHALLWLFSNTWTHSKHSQCDATKPNKI